MFIFPRALCRARNSSIARDNGADPSIKTNKGRIATNFALTWDPSVIDLFDDPNDFIKEPGEL
jgi:hypothetical protein